MSTSSGALEGDVQSLGILALLEFLELERRTGVLVVQSPEGRATVELEGGRVRYTALRGLRGEDALRAFLQLQEGYFKFEFRPELPHREEVGQGYSIRALCLEDAIREDELRKSDTLALGGGAGSFVATKEEEPEAERHAASLAHNDTVAHPVRIPLRQDEQPPAAVRLPRPVRRSRAILAVSLVGVAVLIILGVRTRGPDVSSDGEVSPLRSPDLFADSLLGQVAQPTPPPPLAAPSPEASANRPETATEDSLSPQQTEGARPNLAKESAIVASATKMDLGSPSASDLESIPAELDQTDPRSSPAPAGTSPGPAISEQSQPLAPRRETIDNARRDERTSPGAARGAAALPDALATAASGPSLQLPTVWVGELVTAGPGVVSPRIDAPLRLGLSRSGERLLRDGSIELRLLVDHLGKVGDTSLAAPPGLSPRDRRRILAAGEAARFRPATKNGVAVQMWTTVRLGDE